MTTDPVIAFASAAVIVSVALLTVYLFSFPGPRPK